VNPLLKAFDGTLNKINWIIIVCIISSVLLFYWDQIEPSLIRPYLGPIESELIFTYLAFSGENLLRGRVWTLVTALFLHGDPLHLVGNMIFLFVFGNTLENEVKSSKTLTAFFIGGILSFLLSTFFYDPETPMIGASAAIFTLTAIVMLVKPLKFSLLFMMPQGLVAIVYFLYNVAAVYLGFGGYVAYISHVIGFAIGIPFGITWSKEWKRNLLISFGLLVIYFLLQILLVPEVAGLYWV
jgi:membrane associated rhomboid family serine protease